jgi:hypothetical protein
MQPIKTASTLERILRNLAVTLMVLVFSALFIYDGYIGYPKKNLAATRQEIPGEFQSQVTFHGNINEAISKGIKTGAQLANVERDLGAPAWKGPHPDNLNKAVWFGPGGALVVRYNNAGILARDAEWKTGPKTETDLRIQLILGFVLAPLGVLLAVRVLLMSLRGATLSDAGLKPSGRALIPYSAILDWDTSEYKEKGRIHLRYQEDGATRTYTLDDYKLAAFRRIVEEIVARKGFPNPLLAPEQKQPPA